VGGGVVCDSDRRPAVSDGDCASRVARTSARSATAKAKEASDRNAALILMGIVIVPGPPAVELVRFARFFRVIQAMDRPAAIVD
jgi:hypothetical protein